MSKVARETLPNEYMQIYDAFIMPVGESATLDSVILSDENREKIKQFLTENRHKLKFIEYGLKPINKMLFYGASGCGKTYLTQALSVYLQYTLLTVDIAQALSSDQVAHNISQIFKLANYLGECILFFDECDAIAWNRDREATGSDVARRATNSIFQHVDNMNKTNVFIAATNMLHRLDPAFERRFNMKLIFERPNVDLKGAIQKFLLPKFRLIDDVDETTSSIVVKRSVLSYGEIQDLVERCMKAAIINNTDVVRTADVFREMAISQKIKLKFQTDRDDPRIFQSAIH
jgi:AAA+ superfamily predicted ATPase